MTLPSVGTGGGAGHSGAEIVVDNLEKILLIQAYNFFYNIPSRHLGHFISSCGVSKKPLLVKAANPS